MATIKVRVVGEIATNLTPETKLVCQNDKYDVEFEFDESWANYNFKTALFIYNGQSIPIPFDREQNGNVCKIPALYDTELLHIGVKSNDIDGLHTSTPARVGCLLSANDIANGEIANPTPSQYDEIIALLNQYITSGGSGGVADLKDYQKKVDENLQTLDKTVVGAINEVKDKAQSALDKADEIGNELVLLDERITVDISDAQTNANNYTDAIVDGAVKDINTESIEPLQTQVDIHDRNIATLQDEVVRVEGIAKGAQEGASYESYYDMVTELNGGDKSLLKKHQSVLIGTDDVPDLWVYVIADTRKQYIYTSEEAFANDLIINKSVQVGYFIFKRLEFGKVPLENYYTKEEVDQIKQDAVNEVAIYVEEWF